LGLKELSHGPVDVFRNNEIGLDVIDRYDKIMISPGPGIPSQAGVTKEMIGHFAPVKSILGVCLGCQAIAEVFGGSLTNLDKVYHGVATNINILDENDKIFKGIPESFTAGRYHSWVVNENDFPSTLSVTAKDDEGMIMAIAHRTFDVKGVQFHPESVLTEYGKQMIKNWLDI
jgi:anthranilate synthase component 2